MLHVFSLRRYHITYTLVKLTSTTVRYYSCYYFEKIIKGKTSIKALLTNADMLELIIGTKPSSHKIKNRKILTKKIIFPTIVFEELQKSNKGKQSQESISG